jgi:hypothetical protein
MSAAPESVFAALRERLPREGLFRGKSWRTGPEPFPLTARQAGELRRIGPALAKFLETADAFYHAADPELAFFRAVLDQGKPEWLRRLHDAPALRPQLPWVLRPDLLWTEDGFRITEIDGVPGGLGMTDFLNDTYGGLGFEVLRGPRTLGEAFADRDAAVVISREASDYRPETEWMLRHATGRAGPHTLFEPELTPSSAEALRGRTVYRFFELWDEELGDGTRALFDLAARGELTLTAPPKAYFEEKLLLALYRDPFLHPLWQAALGPEHAAVLDRLIPFGWVLDPEPLPPHAVYPRLEIRDWAELKEFSQEQRRLVLKVSGFSPLAWGARGVHVGHDLSKAEWAARIDEALAAFPRHPHLLQEFAASAPVENRWFTADGSVRTEPGVVRLSPYYLLGDTGAELHGVLATVCPPDKKKIHGMTEATLLPCREVDGNGTA